MVELIAAGVTTIDVIVIFALLRVRKGRLKLVLWTTFLNMLFPFIGFLTGEFSSRIFTGWSSLLSGALLALIGIHMLLQDSDDTNAMVKQLSPFLIALAVSLDTFSVSVSFGMLHLEKTLFILASGLFSFVFSSVALLFKGWLGLKNGKILRRFAGITLLVMGVMSCIF